MPIWDSLTHVASALASEFEETRDQQGAFPRLGDEALAAFEKRGTRQAIAVGDVLFGDGDALNGAQPEAEVRTQEAFAARAEAGWRRLAEASRELVKKVGEKFASILAKL